MLKWFSKKEQKDNPQTHETDRGEKESNSEPEEIQENNTGFFGRLKQRLTKTRDTLITRVDRLVLGKKEIDEDLMEELEEILITSDLGVPTTQVLIDSIQEKVKRKELNNPERLKEYLQKEIFRFLAVPGKVIDYSQKPFVILVIGVNGVGKTTTIGKLGPTFSRPGEKGFIGGRRYLSGRGRRATGNLGRPFRGRDHPPEGRL